MVDLSAEMAELWGSLGAPSAGRARIVQFIAARQGEGTSSVARELAHFAARRAGRSVWLVDLDLASSSQYAAIAAHPEQYGALGPAVAATPDGSCFFTVQPPARTPDGKTLADARYLIAHAIGGQKFWVTRFRAEALRGKQTPHVLATDDYWTALRRYADLIIVDSPAADRSQSGLSVAPFMDQTVLVVSGEEVDVRPPAMVRDAISSAGGRCAGVFFNRAPVETPGFLKAVMR